MPKIVPIVEGTGEIEAVPKVLWKLFHEMNRYDIQVAQPKNAHGCSNLTKPGGLEKFVEYAWREPDCGAVLILMDADKRCAKDLAEGFSTRVRAMSVRHSVVTVVAKCEYEAWFLASLETIAGREMHGRPGLASEARFSGDVEGIAGVKGLLDRQFPEGRKYKETEDQALMTDMIDLKLARQRSRSFRRLYHAIEEALDAIDADKMIVTP